MHYLLFARPVVILLGALVTATELVVTPEDVTPTNLWTLGTAVLVVGATALAARFVDPARVAPWAVAVDTLFLCATVVVAEMPGESAGFLVWPVIGLAYFSTPRSALLLACVLGVVMVGLSQVLENWQDPRLIPTSAFMIVTCGALIAFVAQQGRRVEWALADNLSRDRRALVLSRRIRLSDDPHSAINEISREIGTETGACAAITLLFDHDEDYVSDLAVWRSDGRPGAASIDVRTFDPTLRYLLAAGHGACLTRRGLVVLDSELQLLPSPADIRSIAAPLERLLERTGDQSILIVPLTMGGRSVGGIVLTGVETNDWMRDTVPLLESLGPQIAAGLAQVILLRDQRDALVALRRVDAMRDRLIASVSHELRTPLTSTLGFIETLLRDDLELSERTRMEMMEHARDGGRRLLALVEDLLALGSTRPESLDLATEPLSVSELVAIAARDVSPPADRTLRIDLEYDARVIVDRNRMLQVLVNLTTNALHHGTGDIEVRCWLDEKCAVVDVLDDGDGVAPEHVNELFLPFARFSQRTDSTGLGLAICRAIVEAHGGTIDYGRTKEGRTRFRLRMPAIAADAVIEVSGPQLR
ncbi:MAG: Osmosensitive channel histidine kinase KdpD [Thermoleophilia bacterium]|nr:Osmosensitive channel histidine kinase KdpD [Thermoleophilia bacterium]